MTTVEETLAMMKEVTKHFATPADELDKVEAVLRIQAEIDEYLQKEQQCMKETIKDLVSRTRETERQIKRPELVEVHQKRLAALQAEKENVGNQISELDIHESASRQVLDKAKRRGLDLDKRSLAIEEEQVGDLPRLQHMLHLYLNITRTKWDRRSDNVKGFISRPGENPDLVPFEVDPKINSASLITNHLWELMG